MTIIKRAIANVEYSTRHRRLGISNKRVVVEPASGWRAFSFVSVQTHCQVFKPGAFHLRLTTRMCVRLTRFVVLFRDPICTRDV